MSAEILVNGLNALYLAPMALVSLVGTATLLKLISTFIRTERPYSVELLTVEDA